MKTYIDLHIHSTASDGTLSPTQIVNSALKLTAKEHNPVVIALTDHDTIAGNEEFIKAAARHKDRLTAIPGVEISTNYHGTEIHMLGYNIDTNNKELLHCLQVCRESRDGRNEKIIKKLQAEGFEISMEDIQPDKPGETIARPHIAKQLMKKKYVSSVQEAFDKYLAEGRSCYVERIMPTPREAISLIRNSGGIPVLAHIMLYKKLDSAQKNKLVYELKEAGLMGIEAYYNTYSPVEEEYVKSLAVQWGLLMTGGTDFHGKNKPHISLFTGQGKMDVPEEILPEFVQEL
ncbi:MAG: PHP domain-containing protein [Eubacterium sp.]|nr:PHP domain-containing protein [Eubacterium sp.]MDD7209130.1 PHP domain-containing protein [Lachnospiraceae bacterium]MDY5498228.1 PHP domain-containing protein [Anaerobutyricum sp.]